MAAKCYNSLDTNFKLAAFSATINFLCRLAVFATKRVDVFQFAFCSSIDHLFQFGKQTYWPPYNQCGSMVSSLDSVKCNLNEFEFVKQNDWVNSSCWFKRVFMFNFSRWLISIFSFFLLQTFCKIEKSVERHENIIKEVVWFFSP